MPVEAATDLSDCPGQLFRQAAGLELWFSWAGGILILQPSDNSATKGR